MECEHIQKKHNRYEAQLPSKFNSPNKRSVQVYINESLSSRIRSFGESDLDIYGLVTYIVFDLYSEDERNKSLFKAKRWICEKLSYSEFLNSAHISTPSHNHLKWLKEVKKQRKKRRELPEIDNEVYDEEILEQYVMFPHQKYLDEGVDYLTQVEFQIGYDIKSQRIIFPIHNRYGEIISVKGRTIHDDYEARDIYKFMYLYNFNKMVELYNWHRAVYYILEKKEIIIFEGEKSCWMSSQYGYRNCVAISGDDLSEWQVNLIRELGNEIDIVIALDKDKRKEDIVKQASKFGKTRNVYALWDQNNLLQDKDSPCDKGEVVFFRLYSENRYKIPS
ncbi:toprim domain-containing protein [Paenibacillus spiritus]|uniref:Toprim domain-containing protein n=2 Tax=Paenibacillus spiritus TaxID=2496557 RepID=A0A5J5GJP7_9BACL|nr:toprim domain-containing protein [Paenibacillus spiritus]